MDLQKKTILVVDDEPLIRESLNMILGSQYHLSMARNGEEAIKCLQKEQFDLVTLDIDMPGLSGLDTLAQIKKRWPGLEVIMVSGHGNLRNAQEAILKGASNFISKPFRVGDVLNAVRKAFERNNPKMEEKPLPQEHPF